MYRTLGLLMVLLVFPMGAEADVYTVDSVHTYAIFNIRHSNIATNYGRFNVVNGQIDYADVGKTNAVKIEIDAASIDTANRKRDKHLRSDDFFHVKQFPTIVFESTNWKKIKDDTFEVAGTLNLHGVTKPLTAMVTKTGQGKDRKGNDRIGFIAHFKVDRFAHGMDGAKKGLGQFVNVTLSLEAGVKKTD